SSFVATSSTGLPSCLSHCATCWSPAVTPSRPSTAKRIRSASCTAASTRRWIGFSQRSPDHRPPVSSTVNARPESVTTRPSLTSRVTPGWSATIASFAPTSRLNSADLPTLGRPTIATLAKARPLPHAAAVRPVARAHLASPGRLHAHQAHGALAGADGQPLGAYAQHCAGLGCQPPLARLAGDPDQLRGVVRGHAQRRDLDPRAAEGERGPRPRRHAAEAVADGAWRVGPAHVAVLGGEQWRVGRQGVVLGGAG